MTSDRPDEPDRGKKAELLRKPEAAPTVRAVQTPYAPRNSDPWTLIYTITLCASLGALLLAIPYYILVFRPAEEARRLRTESTSTQQPRPPQPLTAAASVDSDPLEPATPLPPVPAPSAVVSTPPPAPQLRSPIATTTSAPDPVTPAADIPLAPQTEATQQQVPQEQAMETKTLEEFKAEVYKRIDAANTSRFSNGVKLKAREKVKSLNRLVPVVTVQFEKGQSILAAPMKAVIADAIVKGDAKAAFEDRNAVVVVLGYADSSGTPRGNATLSENRANNVSSYLSDLQVKQTVEAFGVGETTLQSEKTSDTSMNRAVEIWIASRQ